MPPVYDRAGLALSGDERAKLEAEGRKPHWRFMLEREFVEWDDLSRGASRIDCASLSDPVLVREDGAYLYTLPSVVDDIELGVTHVIRGEDHVTNTAVQLQLFSALAPDRPAPAFAHHNLLATASGEGLSKRTGALSIGALREQGVEALAVAALAVLTGTSDSVHPVASLDDLAQAIDLSHVSHHAAKFDEADLVAVVGPHAAHPAVRLRRAAARSPGRRRRAGRTVLAGGARQSPERSRTCGRGRRSASATSSRWSRTPIS